MKVCILSIGSELLEGSVVDTNSAFLGHNLSKFGATPNLIRMIPDNETDIVNAFKEYSKDYDIILTTGGLGPTFDDITATCLAKAANIPLELNNEAYSHMENILLKRNVQIGDNHRHQATLPVGCKLYPNNVGTAMGYSINLNKSQVICMPGVPIEMKDMFLNHIFPELKEKFNLTEIISLDLCFFSLPESDLDNIIRDFKIKNNTSIIINAGKGQVVVKIRGYNQEEINSLKDKLINAYPNNYIDYNNSNPAYALVQTLLKNNKTLSTAESCTGGMIGKLITDISGSSSIYYGSVVSYDNSIKQNILHVSDIDLKEKGAVSFEVCKSMVENVRKLMNTDYAISVTGIAGPGGGTIDKPVGTVYIGVSGQNKTDINLYHFSGDREQIRIRTAYQAIFDLIKLIKL